MPAVRQRPEKQRFVSVTISPLHYLVFPPFQLALEVRPVAHLGVAVVGAYGSITEKRLDISRYEQFDAYKFGGHVAYYLLSAHPFDGPELGAAMVYAHVFGPFSDVEVAPGNDGLGIGPFVGYKLIASCGLTFENQIGFEYVTARSHAYALQQGTTKVGGDHFAPLFNVDIGWSF